MKAAIYGVGLLLAATCCAAEMPNAAEVYRRAFEAFGALALWKKRLLEDPTPGDALVVARSLRMEGNLQARKLAEQLEQACRAAV